jgi:predicted GIY-YIG superfamily endonuclease
MYKLYWIKYPEHQDPLTEGYIGITSQTIEKRFSDHKHNNKNKHLKNRCRQNNVEIICLEDNLEKEEARTIEEKYRPFKNIGWNINKGGDLPPSRKGKSNPSIKGNDRTEKQKLASKKHAEFMKGKKFSSERKNRVNHSKPCENCNTIFNPGYRTKQKFCSIKCATETRNKNKEYIETLSKLAKERWSNPEFKSKVSLQIKKSLSK